MQLGMRVINGVWYDGVSSHRRAADLHVDDSSLCVMVEGKPVATARLWGRVEIDARLGDTPRRIRFLEGGLFETTDNDAIDCLQAGHRKFGWLYWLESRWYTVLVAFVIVVLVAIVATRVGFPTLARIAAEAVPAKIGASLDQQVIALLDRRFLEPSKLEEATQQRLRERFIAFLPRSKQGVELKIFFRNADKTIGPNAMALPGGTILITDQLVKLAQNDNQLLAIYAHEAGHVSHRHALRQTIQASFLSLLAVAIAGDVSSVSSVITTLPVILTQLGYSRNFEREADSEAVNSLSQAVINHEEFALILERLEAWQRCELPRDSGAPPCKPLKEGDNLFNSYLSTHPPIKERIAFIRGAR